MNWGPITPAQIDFSDPLAPAAPAFGDVYHARAGALAQAEHVFLRGNGLPGRWAGRPRFVVLETGFGLGHNFLATWAAWRQHAQRCDRLWYVAIEKHPPGSDDLARAHAASPLPALARQLIAAWPPLTPDLHTLQFEGGRLRLLLALGDVARVLPDLLAQADAIYLDGFAPARNPAMWDAWRLRSLARLAAPGATVATWSVAGEVRQGLRAAGFDVHKAAGLAPKREMTVGRFAPRFQADPPLGRQAWAAGAAAAPPQVAVIGAGLAGAAVAQALAALGLAVRVYERRGGCAAETSGNPAGLFHGSVHGHDGPHARWLRAAALHTERVLRPLIEAGALPGAGPGARPGAVPGAINGLLRGEQTLDAAAMAALIERMALPASYVSVRADALPAKRPAWFYPGGGWVSPAALCAHWLAAPGIETRYNTAVHRLSGPGWHGPEPGLEPGLSSGRWRLLDAQGHCLDQVDAVVLCNAADAQRLLAPDTGAAAGGSGPRPAHWPMHWPIRRQRGQTTLLSAAIPGLPALPLPIADAGYALRLADGRLLCGGGGGGDDIHQADDDDPTLRAADHALHLRTLSRLTDWAGTVDPTALGGRVGWRLFADDKLPLLGPVPADDQGNPRQRLDQPRFVPRQPGLWVFTALGSRGISQAALGAELLAAWITSAPAAAPAPLLDALDPARFVVRQHRRALRHSG